MRIEQYGEDAQQDQCLEDTRFSFASNACVLSEELRVRTKSSCTKDRQQDSQTIPRQADASICDHPGRGDAFLFTFKFKMR